MYIFFLFLFFHNVDLMITDSIDFFGSFDCIFLLFPSIFSSPILF